MDKVSGKFWSLQPQYSCLSGWSWAGAQPGICSARPTWHCAFCFSSIQFCVKMEKGAVPGVLGMGLQPSVSSRGCSWDAPESQCCLRIEARASGQQDLRACRHMRPGVRPLRGPQPLDPGRVRAGASGSLPRLVTLTAELLGHSRACLRRGQHQRGRGTFLMGDHQGFTSF